MMQRKVSSLLVGTLFIVILTLLQCSQAMPFYPSGYQSLRNKSYLFDLEDPEEVLEILEKLNQNAGKAVHDGSNSKRGLDLGLGRGFSGSQAAKHLMGLAAANFAAGPGKKKRVYEWNSNPAYVQDVEGAGYQDSNFASTQGVNNGWPIKSRD